MRRAFVMWYMGRIAGRYCPCEWPVKVQRLIRLCARIDDARASYDFKDFAAFYLANHSRSTTTSSSVGDVKVDWRLKP